MVSFPYYSHIFRESYGSMGNFPLEMGNFFRAHGIVDQFGDSPIQPGKTWNTILRWVTLLKFNLKHWKNECNRNSIWKPTLLLSIFNFVKKNGDGSKEVQAPPSRFRSWFVDLPVIPLAKYPTLHAATTVSTAISTFAHTSIHATHASIENKLRNFVMFCWNSSLLNAKNQDRSSQIEQTVNNEFQLSRGATQCNTMQHVYFKFTTLRLYLGQTAGHRLGWVRTSRRLGASESWRF